VVTVAPDPFSTLPDSDQDGLPDGMESQFYAFWYDPDTDDDGLLDGEEVFVHHTAPNMVDSDGDGLWDPDCDQDGLLDGAEVFDHGTNPWGSDSDGDGLSDPTELQWGTDPLVQDTDGGGATDREEWESATDPHDDADDDHAGSDYDQDGLPDRLEASFGLRLWDPDFDQDGLLDGAEVFDHATDPRMPDTYFGGERDGDEVLNGRDPLVAGDDVL
jgi:hypothetical protein